MVSITDQQRDWRCSAVIITTRHLLTTAQCVATITNTSTTIITVLDYNLNQEDPHQFSVEAVKAVTHPDYSPSSSSPAVNDIGVVEISPTLDWRRGARPVCWGPSPPSPPSSLVYTAWGPTQFGQSALPQQVSLPLTLSCQSQPGQLCAGPGSAGQQPCQVSTYFLKLEMNVFTIYLTKYNLPTRLTFQIKYYILKYLQSLSLTLCLLFC